MAWRKRWGKRFGNFRKSAGKRFARARTSGMGFITKPSLARGVILSLLAGYAQSKLAPQYPNEIGAVVGGILGGGMNGTGATAAAIGVIGSDVVNMKIDNAMASVQGWQQGSVPFGQSVGNTL